MTGFGRWLASRVAAFSISSIVGVACLLAIAARMPINDLPGDEDRWAQRLVLLLAGVVTVDRLQIQQSRAANAVSQAVGRLAEEAASAAATIDTLKRAVARYAAEDDRDRPGLDRALTLGAHLTRWYIENSMRTAMSDFTNALTNSPRRWSVAYRQRLSQAAVELDTKVRAMSKKGEEALIAVEVGDLAAAFFLDAEIDDLLEEVGLGIQRLTDEHSEAPEVARAWLANNFTVGLPGVSLKPQPGEEP